MNRPFRLNVKRMLWLLGLLVTALVAGMLIIPGAHHAVREWVHGLPV